MRSPRRSSSSPQNAADGAASGFQDLHRYWWYELRLASGEDPAMLLAELRAGRSAVSEYGPLFDGLAGHLLAQNGSSREALPRLRAAAEDARRLQRTDPTYRVHLAILEDRLAALTP